MATSNKRAASLDLSLILLEMLKENVPDTWHRISIDWLLVQYTDKRWGVVINVANVAHDFRSHLSFDDVADAQSHMDLLEEVLCEIVAKSHGRFVSIDLN